MAAEKISTKSTRTTAVSATSSKKTTTKTKSAAPRKPAAKKTAAKKKTTSMWTLELISTHIRDRAYYLWEAEQYPDDRDFDIWLKAEQEVLSQIMR